MKWKEIINLKLPYFCPFNCSLWAILLATFVGEQGLVQELSGGPEVGGNVGIGKVIQLNAHVGDVHAWVEGLASVDASAVGHIEDVSDAHPLQPGLVDCHWPERRARWRWKDREALSIKNKMHFLLRNINNCIYQRSPSVTNRIIWGTRLPQDWISFVITPA